MRNISRAELMKAGYWSVLGNSDLCVLQIYSIQDDEEIVLCIEPSSPFQRLMGSDYSKFGPIGVRTWPRIRKKNQERIVLTKEMLIRAGYEPTINGCVGFSIEADEELVYRKEPLGEGQRLIFDSYPTEKLNSIYQACVRVRKKRILDSYAAHREALVSKGIEKAEVGLRVPSSPVLGFQIQHEDFV